MMRDAFPIMKAAGAARWRGIFAGAVLVFAAFASAHPAYAQAPGTGLASNFRANSDKPIEIQADMLEVDDKTKIATFRGGVSATQGDFNIKSKELVVSYLAGKPATGDAANSPLPGGGGGEINQIDAKGNVIITTKDKQEATGDLAVFQVKKQLVVLTGDVKVKQGTNIIACEKATVNLTTGIMTMVPKGTAAAGETGAAEKGKVKIIFYPPESKDKDKAPAGGKSGAASSGAANVIPAPAEN